MIDENKNKFLIKINRMKITSGVSIFLLLVLFHLCSCHKDQVSYYAINGSLKNNLFFKTGTYWIYKDSLTGDIDSFVVTSSTQGTSPPVSNGGYVENIYIHINEYSISPANYSNMKKWDYLYQGNSIDVYNYNAKVYTGQVEYVPLVNYPFTYSGTQAIDGAFMDYIDTTNLINIDHNYPLSGINVDSVAVVRSKADMNFNGYLPPYYYSDTFFISSKIGIVKMKLNHPQDTLRRIWEIQKWNIIL